MSDRRYGDPCALTTRERVARLEAENARLRAQAAHPNIDALPQIMSRACEAALREAGFDTTGVTVGVTMEW